MSVGARKVSASGIFYCAKKALGVGVGAHPQGPLAHGTLFPVGFECSLAISLGGEGIEMGAHLWTEDRSRSAGRRALGACPACPLPLLSFVCPCFHLE